MTGRILIVDDVATNRIMMKVKLATACYDVRTARTAAAAMEALATEEIDLLVMDVRLPDMSGIEATRRLRRDPETADVPILLVASSDAARMRIEGLSAGADDVVSWPLNEMAFLARVRSLLRARCEDRDTRLRMGGLLDLGLSSSPKPAGFGENGQAAFAAAPPKASGGRIALVGGTASAALAEHRDRLQSSFRHEVSMIGREEVLAIGAESAPDVFLIDADCCGAGGGLRLMSELRSRRATRHSACIIVLPADDTERAANALDLGADDVIYKPAETGEIALRLRTQLARKRRADRMRDTLDTGLRLAVIDPLTGLHNRRYGLNHLEQVAARARAQGIRAGVILMDLDHFKAINDTHGHKVGDLVLSRVAQVLSDGLRAEDLVARIGGEEFLAILPNADLEQVRAAAERLRLAIESLRIPLPDGGALSVTLSLGVAMLDDHADAPGRAVERADRALYAAKAEGRNRTQLAAS
jgi:two-component system cell cycle response regulator